jgi:hypothetical protein
MAKMIPADQMALACLREALGEVVRVAKDGPTDQMAKRIRDELGKFAAELEDARAETDKIRLPKVTFDPFEPKTVGRMVALATLAQPTIPLSAVPDAYGAGVYAIYYDGDHPLYERIRGTETPIYVGKADPKEPDSSTPREQGKKLTDRLHEHAKTIEQAEKYTKHLPRGLHPIRLADFKCRRLVCATNAQLVAERHLIRMFWPLWNSETKACWGMSKHGDAAETRKNKRSPWNVVHPGKPSALNPSLEDAISPDQIQERIDRTLAKVPPRTNHAALLEEILAAFRQEDAPEESSEEEELIPPVGAGASGPEPDEAGEEDD